MRAGDPDSGLAAGARSSGLVAGDLVLGFGAPGSGLKAQGSGLGARGWKLGLRSGLERRARAAGLAALGWGLPGAESSGLLARSGYCVLKCVNLDFFAQYEWAVATKRFEFWTQFVERGEQCFGGKL